MADIRCTYCLGTPVLASKTCAQCKTPMCDNHATAHKNTVNHVIFDLNSSPNEWQCSEHKEVLKYYCTSDNVGLCQTCYNNGEHKNHSLRRLYDFAAKRKKSLINDKKKLKKMKDTKEKLIETMKNNERAQVSKAGAVHQKVNAQIIDIREQITTLSHNVNHDIKHMRDAVLRSIAEQTRKLEGENAELHNKIELIEDLCAQHNVTFLNRIQEADLMEIQNNTESQIQIATFDGAAISVMLHKELLEFADDLTKRMLKVDFPKMKKSKITLDKNTAYYKICISYDLRSALYTENRFTRAAGKERFWSHHVLSECSFSSGNHYWEVEVKGTQCSIGVAYDNLERKTTRKDAHIGYNTRSWSLSVESQLSVWHNHVETAISTDSSVRAFGIFLEYSAGRLSFYQLCDPIRHLHSFTTPFTRPLHAAFYMSEDTEITIL